MDTLKRRIRAGETVHGCWLNLASPLSAEIVGRAGFDWALIDLEHGAGTETEALAQLQALQGGAATPVVRVESGARQRIQRVLDLGARGVMVPQIRTVDDARTAMSALYYPPTGTRGAAKMVRATNFGRAFDAYMAGMQDTLVGMVQIETADALKCVDEIAALDHVDVLFVGPADLTLALGIFGRLEHELYQNALRATARAARAAGKAAGVLLLDVDQYEMYRDLGFRVLACGSDGLFVERGARATAERLAAKRAH